MGRTQKLLEPKTVAKKRQAIHERNATESPLLRLPPEVRNRIWTFLLGGRTIHIWWTSCMSEEPQRMLHSVSQADTDDVEAAQAIKALHDPVVAPSYATRHRGCMIDDPEKTTGVAAPVQQCLPVHVLTVCRQIHQEAALLPFAENTFTFMCAGYVSRFAATLVSAQARTVKSILYLKRQHNSATEEAAAMLTKKMTGLRNITVILEIEYLSDYYYFDQLVNWGFDIKQSDLTLNFQRLPVEKVTALAYTTEDKCRRVVQKSVIDQWAEAVERQTMGEWDGLTFPERSRAKKEAAQKAKEDAAVLRKQRTRADGRLGALKED